MRICDNNRLRKYAPEILVVAGLATVSFLLLSGAFPLWMGRDTEGYYRYYASVFETRPDSPYLMVFRTPVTPFLFGVAWDLGGTWGVSLVHWVSWILSSLLVYFVGRWFSVWAAILAVALFLTNTDAFYWFRTLASESPSVPALAALPALALVAVRRPIAGCGALGAWVFVLTMIRPGNLLFLSLAVLPFLIADWRHWRRSLLAMVVFLFAAGLPLAAYVGINKVRYDFPGVAIGGPAHIPFYRVFQVEKMVRPEYGPASARLAELVREDVLTRPVFQQYGVTEEDVFATGTWRSYYSILHAYLHRYGMKDNFSGLMEVGIETARERPIDFFGFYLRRLLDLYKVPGFRGPVRHPFLEEASVALAAHREELRSVGLPIPSEGDVVPAYFSYVSYLPPDYEPSAEPLLGWKPPAKAWEFERKPGNEFLRVWMPRLGWAHRFLSAFVFAGLLGLLLFFRRADVRAVWMVTAIGTGVLLVSLMGNPEMAFRPPYDSLHTTAGSIFIGLGIERILKRRSPVFPGRKAVNG